MEKILTEIYRGVKEKVSSPFLRYFTLSWIITNYKFLYILLFQDEKLSFQEYGMLKIDYLTDKCIYGNILYNILFFIIIPFFSALFFIFLFPWINREILKIYRENIDKDEDISQEFKLKEIEREIERAEKRLEKNKIELEEKETEEKIENINNTDKEYTDEFYKIYKDKIFDYFDKIIKYSNLQKPIAKNNGFNWSYSINENIINIYISLDIISLKTVGNSKIITLSDKGKYFSKLYTINKIEEK